MAEGVERQERLALVLPLDQIDADPFVGNAQQLEQQAHFVAVAGEFVAVEAEHGIDGRRGLWSGAKEGQAMG